MPPEDPQNSNTESSPSDLVALVSELAASVSALIAQNSALTARLDRIERIISLGTVPHEYRDLQAPPAGSPLPSATPPPPLPSGVPHVTLLRSGMNPPKDSGTLAPKASFEDRLGSQIFNRIAIVAILIGAALGLKLAIDNHLIGPLGRILVGLLVGAGLVVWSERFRRREFAAFSYSLKAIGSGILYLSLWAAFQLYHLLPAEAAFGLMLVVTLWNAWMAWAQSSELLAFYAVAGGFATPLLLSTEGNHQVFLFSYLLSIDLAAIVLVRLEEARSNSWARLLLAALPSTVAYFIGWFTRFYTADQLASTSVFIALFFIAFLTVPFVLKSVSSNSSDVEATPGRRAAGPIQDVLLPLGNAVFASLAFYSVLEDSGNHTALPWMSLVFAAIYLAVMRLPQTVAARAVHLSLAVLFITVAIPLKASGRWITIGWLAEGVALLWISARLAEDQPIAIGSTATELSKSETPVSIPRMLRRLAALALTLGFFGLLIIPYWLDRMTRTAFFNQRFATELAGILALGASAWISSRASVGKGKSAFDPNPIPSFPNWIQLAAGSSVALNLVALFAGVREIETLWFRGYGQAASAESSLQTALSISGFFMVYGAALLAIGFWKHNAFLRWQALVLLVIAIAKTFLYDVRSLSQGYRVVSFLSLGVLLLGVSFFYVRKTGTAPDSPRNQ